MKKRVIELLRDIYNSDLSHNKAYYNFHDGLVSFISFSLHDVPWELRSKIKELKKDNSDWLFFMKDENGYTFNDGAYTRQDVQEIFEATKHLILNHYDMAKYSFIEEGSIIKVYSQVYRVYNKCERTMNVGLMPLNSNQPWSFTFGYLVDNKYQILDKAEVE